MVGLESGLRERVGRMLFDGIANLLAVERGSPMRLDGSIEILLAMSYDLNDRCCTALDRIHVF